MGVSETVEFEYGSMTTRVEPLIEIYPAWLRFEGRTDPIRAADPEADLDSDGPPGEGAYTETHIATEGDELVVVWVGYGDLGATTTILETIPVRDGAQDGSGHATGVLVGGIVSGLGILFVLSSSWLQGRPGRGQVSLGTGAVLFAGGVTTVGIGGWTATGDHLAGPGVGVLFALLATVAWIAALIHPLVSRRLQAALVPARRFSGHAIALGVTSVLAGAFALGPWASAPAEFGGTIYGWEGDGVIVAPLMVLAAILAVALRPGRARTSLVAIPAGAAALTMTVDLGRLLRFGDALGIEVGWGLWLAGLLSVGTLALALTFHKTRRTEQDAPRSFKPAVRERPPPGGGPTTFTVAATRAQGTQPDSQNKRGSSDHPG